MDLIKAQIPEHGGFCGTFRPDGRAAAELMARVHNLTVKPFGVDLQVVEPNTLRAISWRKVDGWSTWAVVASNE